MKKMTSFIQKSKNWVGYFLVFFLGIVTFWVSSKDKTTVSKINFSDLFQPSKAYADYGSPDGDRGAGGQVGPGTFRAPHGWVTTWMRCMARPTSGDDDGDRDGSF